VQSQLQTLQYDLATSFSDKVVTNVCKSITMCANKCEQAMSALNRQLASPAGDVAVPAGPDAAYSFISLQPSQLQLRTLEFLNATHDLYEQLGLLFADFGQRLGAALSDRLANSLKTLLLFEDNALQPLFSSASGHVQAILLTLHQEDFSTAAAPSLYMKELEQVLQRVCGGYLRRFTCRTLVEPALTQLAARSAELFVRHASLLRPLADKARQRLVADSLHLEAVIQAQLCPKLSELGLAYKQLKAFRHLLQTPAFPEADESVYTGLVSESLPYSVLLSYLFSFGPADLKSPHQSLDWSPARYSDWLDKHAGERERVLVVKTSLEAYVNSVRQRGDKEFAGVYPLILRLLEKSLQSL